MGVTVMDQETIRLAISVGGTLGAAIVGTWLGWVLAGRRARQERVRDRLVHRIHATREWFDAYVLYLAAMLDRDLEGLAKGAALDRSADVTLGLAGDKDLVADFDAIDLEIRRDPLGGDPRTRFKRLAWIRLRTLQALERAERKALEDKKLPAMLESDAELELRLERLAALIPPNPRPWWMPRWAWYLSNPDRKRG